MTTKRAFYFFATFPNIDITRPFKGRNVPNRGQNCLNFEHANPCQADHYYYYYYQTITNPLPSGWRYLGCYMHLWCLFLFPLIPACYNRHSKVAATSLMKPHNNNHMAERPLVPRGSSYTLETSWVVDLSFPFKLVSAKSCIFLPNESG